MVVTNLPRNVMKEIIKSLSIKFPDINFEPGRQCSWSPATNTVFYVHNSEYEQCLWALFHELGHALLKHKTYRSDLELLIMERDAWQNAKKISTELGITIDEDHIQDCLDTYRDWLDQRSTCPTCNNNSLSSNYGIYNCFNCKSTWRVTDSRFSRPYRQKLLRNNKTSPVQKTQAMFN